MVAQSMVNKKGEVAFRRKLAEQHRGEKHHFDDELDAAGIMEMIDWRMHRTREMIKTQQKNDIKLTPFLEIGAERCQRTLVLENEFGCQGIAADISLDSLLFAERIADKYAYTKMPLRICCDANALPIRSGSMPFVFFYQTIHHFSDPTPVFKSISRILTKVGNLYFDEEPVTAKIACKLFLRGSNPQSLFQKTLLKFHLIDFVSWIGKPEEKAGIVDVNFTLHQWAEMLSIFEYENVIVDSKKLHGRTLAGLVMSNGISRFWIELMGGNIHGLCRKKQKAGGGIESAVHSPLDALICPQCLETSAENSLLSINDNLACTACGNTYPIVKGVFMLFPKILGHALYPEYFN